jgi:uncharacterized membrane protein
MSDPNASPTLPPTEPEALNPALMRNIRALKARREQEEAVAGIADKLSDKVTAFTGSLGFVVLHLLAVACWIAVNIGLTPWMQPFDPSFVILATAASVEAIFLSTFVLISQNRAAAAARRRADLDLQINLLAEHEVTRLIALTSQIAEHLGVIDHETPELDELKRDVAPEAVLDSLEEMEKDPRPRA